MTPGMSIVSVSIANPADVECGYGENPAGFTTEYVKGQPEIQHIRVIASADATVIGATAGIVLVETPPQ